MCFAFLFFVLASVTKAQNKLQDSISEAKKHEIQVNDTKQKIIGTWNYKNTVNHGVPVENKIDSNRVYVFTKTRVRVITTVKRKVTKRKLKYNIYAESDAVAYLEILEKHKNANSECLYFIIKKIDAYSLTFDACYNDCDKVTFTKQ